MIQAVHHAARLIRGPLHCLHSPSAVGRASCHRLCRRHRAAADNTTRPSIWRCLGPSPSLVVAAPGRRHGRPIPLPAMLPTPVPLPVPTFTITGLTSKPLPNLAHFARRCSMHRPIAIAYLTYSMPAMLAINVRCLGPHQPTVTTVECVSYAAAAATMPAPPPATLERNEGIRNFGFH
ncbi:hypothetical protein ACLOJK_028974 [Asimina triloba]